MPRRRRRRDRSQREAFDFSSHRLLDEFLIEDRPAAALVRSSPAVVDWLDVEDRRTWHPEGVERPALDFDAVPVGVVERVPRKRYPVAVFETGRAAISPVSRGGRGREGFRPPRLFAPGVRAFEVPSKTVVCARRKERREVLFAKGKGKGRGGKVRRNWTSEVSCSRS